MADFALAKIQKSLIRKPLAGGAFFAPVDVDIPAAFTTGGTFTIPMATPAGPGGTPAAVPGFTSIGAISKDAAPTFTPETETSDVETWGMLEPSRTDIISRKTSISFTAQETNLKSLELYHNVDLSGILADSTTGEVSFADPTAPDLIYHRAIFVAVDGSGPRAIYIVKVVPNFIITEVSEQAWNDGEAMAYQITGQAKVDEDLGYAVKTHFCGPGWKALLDKTGFKSA